MAMKNRRISKSTRGRRLGLEKLEERRYLTSVGWDGPGQGSAALSYYIGDVPSQVGVTAEQFRTTVSEVLDAWGSVADVTFSAINVPNQRNSIDIEFRELDGGGRTLAQAYLPDDVNSPRIAGDIQFDVAESWEIGNSLGSAAFDLALVLAHEVGHSLGLDHSNISGSVMSPSVSPNQTFGGLEPSDVDSALRLYAATSNGTPTNDGTNGDSPIDGNSAGETPTTGEEADDETDNGETDNDETDNGETDNDETDNDETDNDETNDGPFTRRGPRRHGRIGRGFGRFDGSSTDNRFYDTPTGDTPNENTAPDNPGSDLTLDSQLPEMLDEPTQSPIDDVEQVDVSVDGEPEIDDETTDMGGVEDDDDTTQNDDLDDEVSDPSSDDLADNDSADDDSADDDGATNDGANIDSPNDPEPVEDPVDEDPVDEDPVDVPIDDGPADETPGPGDESPTSTFRERIFAALDADGNGGVTEDEVPRRLWRRLSNADLDGDSSVSLDELLDAEFERHHQCHGQAGESALQRISGVVRRFARRFRA